MSTARPSNDASTTKCDDHPRLTRSQHSRLVKSTRKLTKILGDNPMSQINLPSSISSPRRKYQEVIGAALYSPILSVTKKLARLTPNPLQIACRRDSDIDWDDMGSGRTRPPSLSRWSPILFSRSSFESDLEDHTSYASSQVSTPSPSASSFRKRTSSLFSISSSKSFPLSPPEWERWNEEREARHRRRRVSKLARFLGERIPPDLILPKPGSAKSYRGSPRMRRFLPPPTPPVPPIIPPVRAESLTSQQGSPRSFSPSSSSADGPQPAVETTVEVFETTEPPSSSSDASQFAQGHRRSHSESSISSSHERSMQPGTDEYSETDDHIDAISSEGTKESESGPLLSPPPRSESRLAFLRLRSASPSPEPSAVSHRSERRQGWSGEWNAASMQDVISKLRDLR